jgi:hypothetical protein
MEVVELVVLLPKVLAFREETLGLYCLREFGLVEIFEAGLAGGKLFCGGVALAIGFELLVVLLLELLFAFAVVELVEDGAGDVGLSADAGDEQLALDAVCELGLYFGLFMGGVAFHLNAILLLYLRGETC